MPHQPFSPYELNFGAMFPGKGAQGQRPGREFRYAQNGLTVTCTLDAKGRVVAKRQELQGRVDDYNYRFDDQGHLLEVRLNGRLCEQYGYDRRGRRVMQRRAPWGESRLAAPAARPDFWGGTEALRRQAGGALSPAGERTHFTDGELSYTDQGQLVQAGNACYFYDPQGALSMRRDQRGGMRFSYTKGLFAKQSLFAKAEDRTLLHWGNPEGQGNTPLSGAGTGLARVALPGGGEIRYEYSSSNPLSPTRRYIDNRLTHEYYWISPLRLSACRDHDAGMEFAFAYDHQARLDRLRLSPLRSAATRTPDAADRDWFAAFMETVENTGRMDPLFAGGKPLDLFCCCDQVGTPLAFIAPSGNIVKEIRRDSFGIPYADSLPDLHIPIGFAGGLEDPLTGLVRFGWRDYDPAVGRFTAPDPARDLRGDGDLYDYCVDDPVNNVDPAGLWTSATFDESRISRDRYGQFSSNARGGRSGADAGKQGARTMAAITSSAPVNPIDSATLQRHNMIRALHGEEMLGLYKERDAVEARQRAAATKKEEDELGQQSDMITDKMKELADYKVVFSQGFRDEQRLIAEQWHARLTTPDKTRQFVAMMDAIDAAPPHSRAELVREFFTQLAMEAGMPQTRIVMAPFGTKGEPLKIAGAYADGQRVKLDINEYTRQAINWEYQLSCFFHEQGHELAYATIAGKIHSPHKKDVELLRKASFLYTDVMISSELYNMNYTEQHARSFEQLGLNLFSQWNRYRKKR